MATSPLGLGNNSIFTAPTSPNTALIGLTPGLWTLQITVTDCMNALNTLIFSVRQLGGTCEFKVMCHSQCRYG